MAENPGGTPSPESDISLDELMPKDVYTLVRYLIASLAQQSWIFMGLHMNPFTKTTTKDLTQAKLAIDCAQALTEKLGPWMEEKEKKEYQALLQTLQMNFIQQSSQ
ncbi:MAG: DUF1844 domain-containing protein [Candidatus Eremiobacteraeota bacterium]|nr:DUF1844 domain-containing protein [Candidatus Eremiobacteraeota bacterium]